MVSYVEAFSRASSPSAEAAFSHTLLIGVLYLMVTAYVTSFSLSSLFSISFLTHQHSSSSHLIYSTHLRLYLTLSLILILIPKPSSLFPFLSPHNFSLFISHFQPFLQSTLSHSLSKEKENNP